MAKNERFDDSKQARATRMPSTPRKCGRLLRASLAPHPVDAFRLELQVGGCVGGRAWARQCECV